MIINNGFVEAIPGEYRIPEVYSVNAKLSSQRCHNFGRLVASMLSIRWK